MNIGRNNLASRLGTKFGFDNNISKQQGHQISWIIKARSISHCETNQCRHFPTQVSKFYENPSCVSCFLIGNLRHDY